MSFSKAQIEQMIQIYAQAEIDVLAGKISMVAGKQFTSEDLGEIRKGRIEWENRLSQANSNNSGFGLATFK